MGLTVRFEPPPFDIDDDGTAETMAFELSSSLQITHATRTGFLTGGAGSTVIDILSDIADDLGIDSPIQADGRAGLFTDLGGGQHVIEVEAEIVSGDVGNQWGTGDGDAIWDAAGADVVTKGQLLDKVLQRAEIDSRPADGNYPQGHLGTLSVGAYSESGRFEPIGVVPEEPRTVYDAERESSTATVSINFIEAASLDLPWDAQQQTEA